ncbi:glycosyltransferase [Bosea sp. BK604]|uniref:glycosyltransferase n=1 Tax=Bosea sp. BK604 TaxID=2512180 RepID=UPI001048A7BA|nr:glycosyltransferase [Bosea sp. BK604]TCR70031.1 glycosyltransferase involved in cell wall biosynthesis [Bosea sp. BK604]
MNNREKIEAGQPLMRVAASGAHAGLDVAAFDGTRRGRRVLITDTDIYKTVGGGQSSYRKLIEQSPENTYFYFLQDEPVSAPRPANAVGIPLERIYSANLRNLPAETLHLYWDYLKAWQLAAAVENALGACQFDVVDTPDYYTYGLFIRGALEAHGIRIGTVALALHGTISSALNDIWPHSSASSRRLAELRIRERLQYRSVDARYALSGPYAAEWERRTGLTARMIDPLHIIGATEPVQAPITGEKPDVAFIGRRERRKGPDIFADIAWCLDPASYRNAMLVGSEVVDPTGIGSAATIEAMARLRQVTLQSVEPWTPAQLSEFFRGRSLVVLPSRYDQFNLVVLEALRHGCPAFISRRAGAAGWIEEHYPELSDLVIDIDCSRSAADRIRTALADYDGTRRRIVDTLLARPMRADDRALEIMYEPLGNKDRAAVRSVAEFRHRFDNFNRPHRPNDRSLLGRARLVAAKNLPPEVKRNLRQVRLRLGSAKRTLSGAQPWQHALAPVKDLVTKALTKYADLDAASLVQIRSAAAVEGTRKRLLSLAERTDSDIVKKLGRVSSELGSIRVARAQITRDMARLELQRGGDLIAATYCLRVMRWLGKDQFDDLDFVAETLRGAGYVREAEAAEAMFGPEEHALERSRAILDEQYRRNLTKPDLPLALLDDRRPAGGSPKVSVIVSLYNAESKLRTLLDNISAQSLTRAGQVEVVLVDSASPTEEYEVFKAYCSERSLPIVFARSEKRETIQAAWNRGIKLARAPYLTFLGADEGMHPDCLSILVEALDRDPKVDWVMADSIVTEVDKAGIFNHDVMVYDRTGFDPSLIRLETCYLSWVAGVYRKSIHERFGYYDEDFRAAGDTEFKGRVLTHINTLHVPKRLGVFNNYPEERTTQNPRAEIEDLRAWYLHRTEAGIAYSYDAHPVAEAEELFRRALTYRKSYCYHYSTDFDLAAATAAYLNRRGESGAFAEAALRSSGRLLGAAKQTDELNLQLGPRKRQLQLMRMLLKLQDWERADQVEFGLPQRPHYNLFNDNRHEQHWWSWST